VGGAQAALSKFETDATAQTAASGTQGHHHRHHHESPAVSSAADTNASSGGSSFLGSLVQFGLNFLK